ncbi:MAG: 3-dehydroquinate synthase [Steroidobacteraceae bacterium]
MSSVDEPARIDISLGERSYPIYIGPNLLERGAELLGDRIARDLLIVTNTTVEPLYARSFKEVCERSARRVAIIALPDGEQFKTLETTQTIFNALVTGRFNRDAALIALGGGVVGDIVGFAAACYQRGIDFIQVPTTLLAQVDSSVGGKTGVNHPGGKNLIGAFHQPRAVIADTATLATLPPREFRAGLAEVVKYGFIYDLSFLEWLEANATKLCSRDAKSLVHAIRRSCEIKAEVVAQDERELGLRAILNFGHTFGHAIETAAGYGEWLHGEAVAAGMATAIDMSRRLGNISQADAERSLRLMQTLELPTTPPAIGAQRALELMGMDKKVLQGQLRLVLLRRLGEALITADYPRDILNQTLAERFG